LADYVSVAVNSLGLAVYVIMIVFMFLSIISQSLCYLSSVHCANGHIYSKYQFSYCQLANVAS